MRAANALDLPQDARQHRRDEPDNFEGEGNEVGAYWRFVTPHMSRNELGYIPMTQSTRFALEWADANSGTMSQIVQNSSNLTHHDRIRRIDG